MVVKENPIRAAEFQHIVKVGYGAISFDTPPLAVESFIIR